MFFVAAKIFGLAILVPHLIVEICVVGVVLLWTPWRRAGRIIATLGVLLLFACGFLPVASLLMRPLEDRFAKPAGPVEPFGIIVLGGALDEGMVATRGEPGLNAAAERMTAGAALARRFPKARLVFSGGSGRLNPNEVTESDAAHLLWTSMGVPDAQMSFESRSRDTFENAMFTRDLVKPQPGQQWLLVTSAAHMPRSVGLFRKQQFPVVPWPVDYRTTGTRGDFFHMPHVSDNFVMLDVASHEWVGLLIYWLSGRTDELFPAP